MARIAALIVALFASASALAPTRRNFLGKVAGAVTGASVAAPALADTDYAGLPYLGGSSKIDINNANIRSVSDVYNIKGLKDAEKAAIKKYESRFITLEPAPMYVIDRMNNGLYR
ncbi:photosystem II 12 kDa extrinsic protein PsbU [Aureococcus anophagefferens]|nr:photosystem II 12 kDa extrinsic protein PsbU [Aureococcus anophagefferens]